MDLSKQNLLVLIALILIGLFWQKSGYQSYDQRYHSFPNEIYYPKTLQELQRIIRCNQGRRIRVSGSSHTFNDISISNDVEIRTQYLNKIIGIKTTPNGGYVTAEAGIIIGDLNKALDKSDLALPVQTAIFAQSLGGLISTSAHGSRADSGSFSDMVQDIRMVLSDGRVRTFNQTDPEFDAVSTSLGTLGVIYSVTLKCEPQFYLEHKTVKIPWNEFKKRLPEYRSKYQYLQAYLYPYTKNVLLYLRKRVPKGSGKIAHKVLTRNLESQAPYTEIEIGIPENDLIPALERTLRLYQNNPGYQTRFPILVRWTGQDRQSLLSMTSDRNTAFIDIFIGLDKASDFMTDVFFRKFQAILSEFGGRPHFGKRHYLTRAELRKVYGNKHSDFMKIKQSMDPTGMFNNEYIQRIL